VSMYGSVLLSSFGPPKGLSTIPQSSLYEDHFMVRYKKAKNTLRYRQIFISEVMGHMRTGMLVIA